MCASLGHSTRTISASHSAKRRTNMALTVTLMHCYAHDNPRRYASLDRTDRLLRASLSAFCSFLFPRREKKGFPSVVEAHRRIFFDTGLHLHDASASMQARRQGSHGGEGMARDCEGEKGHFSLMQVVMLKLGYRLTPGENNN